MLTKEKMEDFYEAFWYLHSHPLFTYKGGLKDSSFPENLSISTQKVDPKTRRIEDDKSRNTHIEIWLEVMTYEEIPKDRLHCPVPFDEMYGVPCHHWTLDCGGDTFEEAIIKLASLVKEYVACKNCGLLENPADLNQGKCEFCVKEEMK